MQSIIPVQSQGRSTAVAGFSYASNRHLNDWLLFNKQANDERQSLLTNMDPKMRDIKPIQVDYQRETGLIYDIYERTLEARLLNPHEGWKRDPYREEFIHEDIYALPT